MGGKQIDKIKKRPFKTTTSYYRKVKKLNLFQNSEKIKSNIRRNDTDISESNSIDNFYICNDDKYLHSNLTTEKINENRQTNCYKNKEQRKEVPNNNNLCEEQNSDEECFADIEEKISFSEELRTWALNNKISHMALTDLLCLLRLNGFSYLPKNSKTLLNTPNHAENIVEIANGSYWYNGLERNLSNLLLQTNCSENKISLLFNIDGLPIAKSSKTEFWPILCSIYEMDLPIIVVGVFCGETKPPLEPYFNNFVQEMSSIQKNGLFINKRKISVTIKGFVCDSPARSFIKGVVNFNSYHGCTRCTTVGDYEFNRMSFPRTNCPLRTNSDFRNRKDPEHHKITTPLEMLPINMVDDFIVADSLHLLHLGIMKKLLTIWMTGMYTFDAKWSANDIKNVSIYLINYKNYIPNEINRSPRSLDCLKFWKGSEFGTFLMYIGPVVLKDFLRKDIYEHFLLLFCAITICSSKTYSDFLNVAHKMCIAYIEKYIEIYGSDTITSNVHNLCHIVQDVIRFGPLQSFSSYRFESYLGYIKSLLRQGNKPLAQCSKRITELSKINVNPPIKEIFPIAKEEIDKKSQHSGKKFAKLILAEGVILARNNKNKWFMTKQNDIVCMLYATFEGNELKVYGSSIKDKKSFFTRPLQSSYLNIYVCEENLLSPEVYSLNDIKCKLISLPYHNQIVFLPLIHTLDLLNK